MLARKFRRAVARVIFSAAQDGDTSEGSSWSKIRVMMRGASFMSLAIWLRSWSASGWSLAISSGVVLLAEGVVVVEEGFVLGHVADDAPVVFGGILIGRGTQNFCPGGRGAAEKKKTMPAG